MPPVAVVPSTPDNSSDSPRTLTHLDLFSGIGGFALAARWTGRIRTVAFCDSDPFCRSVLHKHWPDTPIYDDIRTLTRATLLELDIRSVDLVTGGFPCQPFSAAGKQRGAEDDRHLWPEMRRVVAELRPRWVVGENVFGFVHLALDDVLADLAGEGYEAWALVLPACAVAAPHRRERVFVVAHADDPEQRRIARSQARPARASDRIALSGTAGQPRRVDAAAGERRAEQWNGGGKERRARGDNAVGSSAGWLGWTGERPCPNLWRTEPAMGRVADRIPRRVDRLKALGNAVVPQVVHPLLQAILDAQDATT